MRNKNCDRKLYCDDYQYNHCDGCGGNKQITIADLNFSINTIKALCISKSGCIDCPMNKNCNEFPPKWEEVTKNEETETT